MTTRDPPNTFKRLLPNLQQFKEIYLPKLLDNQRSLAAGKSQVLTSELPAEDSDRKDDL